MRVSKRDGTRRQPGRLETLLVSSLTSAASTAPELAASGVCVERLVIITRYLVTPKGSPIDRRIQNVGGTLERPFEPGMGFAACRGSLPNHQANVSGAVFVHLLIKGNRFTFAIGNGSGRDFTRSLPFRTKS